MKHKISTVGRSERKVEETSGWSWERPKVSRCVGRILEQEESDVIKWALSEARPEGNSYPPQLQSSSISRGRQIKLLTQYPLYSYNKDLVDDPSASYNQRLRTLHLSRFSSFCSVEREMGYFCFMLNNFCSSFAKRDMVSKMAYFNYSESRVWSEKIIKFFNTTLLELMYVC